MRILYHHRTRAEDAQGVHICALVGAFRELGHTVEVVEPRSLWRAPERAGASRSERADSRQRGTAGQREVAAEAGPTLAGRAIPHWLYELLALAYNAPAFAWLLARVLARRPDLIYERYSLLSFAGLLVARLIRRPFILEVNAPLSLELRAHGGLVWRRPAQWIEDWLCRSATRTVVVSHAMGQIFIERGVPAGRLLVLPNGVDGSAFHPRVDGDAIRARYGLTGCQVVGFVGWIRPWHGVDGLLEAMAPRLHSGSAARLLIVGDGPAVPDLQRQAEALGIAEWVVFTGAIERAEVPAHIAALDIAVQPDVTEYASPIKLFEYLAVGRAVVAPDRPNIREVVEDGVSARLFPPNDWQALADRLVELLEDGSARKTLAENGAYRIHQQGYTWLENARRVLAAVEAVTGRRVAEGEAEP
ncbi:MAG: glycosyltransferase family 4 protein [Halorhodospira sp.]